MCVQDQGGWYDMENLSWEALQDVVFAASCRPPGSGGPQMSARWTRHLATVFMPMPSEVCMRQLFEPLLVGFFSRHFSPDVRELLACGMVAAAVDAHLCISEALLPTASHLQYRFNLHTVAAGLQVRHQYALHPCKLAAAVGSLLASWGRGGRAGWLHRGA
jgi:hypothetical protein